MIVIYILAGALGLVTAACACWALVCRVGVAITRQLPDYALLDRQSAHAEVKHLDKLLQADSPRVMVLKARAK